MTEIDKLNYEIASLQWAFKQIIWEIENLYTKETLPDAMEFVLYMKDQLAKTDSVAAAMQRVCEASRVYVTGDRSSKDLNELCYAVDATDKLMGLAK